MGVTMSRFQCPVLHCFWMSPCCLSVTCAPLAKSAHSDCNSLVEAASGDSACEVRVQESFFSNVHLCRKGMDLYFKRHDGQAVTCDDFRNAMADANDRDLSSFSAWCAN